MRIEKRESEWIKRGVKKRIERRARKELKEKEGKMIEISARAWIKRRVRKKMERRARK